MLCWPEGPAKAMGVVKTWCLLRNMLDLLLMKLIRYYFLILHCDQGHRVTVHCDQGHRVIMDFWTWLHTRFSENLRQHKDEGHEGIRYELAKPRYRSSIILVVQGLYRRRYGRRDAKILSWPSSLTTPVYFLLACAPRYVSFSVKLNRREPVGNCFISTGREDEPYRLYSPCLTEAWGYHRQGSCQAGFGAALTSNGNRLYVGAVGSWYWQGQVFYKNLLNRAEAASTNEGPQRDDMSYLGYSMDSGHFNGDIHEDIVVGMPRGNDLTGQVVVLDHQLNILYNITGDQIGSYFGYSVTVNDFNADGLDDVAVGAPWYTDPGAPSGDYDVGAVVVFAQTKQHNFRVVTQLQGHRTRSHFGVSVASLGDIDLDGFGDLAVGAPYDGQLARGGVYIYRGTAKGLDSKPSQILLAEEFTQYPLLTFGWSLSGGEDLDGNEYPDLLVGAYVSNRALVFRTRPVVNVTAQIRWKSESGAVDLEERPCSLQDGTAVPCVPLHYCLQYSGINVPKEMILSISLSLDVLSDVNKRMFFLKREGRHQHNTTTSLRKDVNSCDDIYVYALADPGDKLTPLVAELKYQLGRESHVPPAERLRAVLAPSPPRDDETNVLPIHQAAIHIRNNCGNDNVCVPDLRTKASISGSEYIHGSLSDVLLTLDVANHREDAFQARVRIRIPKGIPYSKFSVLQNTNNDHTPICYSNFTLSNATYEEVLCELGNPLPAGAKVKLQLSFQPNPAVIAVEALDFNVTSISANEEHETNIRDNHVALALPVISRSHIDIKGLSLPDGQFIDYNASRFGEGLLGPGGTITHEREAGPEVMHVYDVTNQGPSDLTSATLHLLWPTRTVAGDPLLYLMDAPAVSGPAICHSAPNVNYLNIQVEESSYDHLLGSPNLGVEDAPGSLFLQNRLHNVQDQFQKQRQRRDLSIAPPTLDEALSCGGTTNCTIVTCTVDPFTAGDNVVLRVRSRLWVDTIEKLGMSELKISSRLVIVNGQKESGTSHPNFWSGTVTSVVRVGPEKESRSLSWLIVLGAVLAGLLLLAILCAILWSCGFFKRRRPQESSESEPLNGHTWSNGKS
ncbi:unnamed protein product, partial [Meganyctiphanes norvegica]